MYQTCSFDCCAYEFTTKIKLFVVLVNCLVTTVSDSANSKNAVVVIIVSGGAVAYYSSISTVFFEELPQEGHSR